MRLNVLCMLVGILLAHCNRLSGNTPDNNAGLAVPLQTMEGDIILNEKQLEAYRSWTKTDDLREKKAVTMIESDKWLGGIVPYVLSPDFSEGAHTVIMTAINQFMEDTCVKFKKKEPADFDHLYFYPGTACMSFVGRQEGRQNISIGPKCEQKGVVMHEIFHALGRWHEHSRADRNEYVRVNLNNVLPDEKLRDNFRIERNSDTQNIAYDYDSIMHYDAYAFSSNDQPTIQPVDETIPLTRIGQRNALSERDKRHIQQLYCKDYVGEWGSWSDWTSCSTSCGPGIRHRTRTCLGGTGCQGDSVFTDTCSHGNCPPQESTWGAWTSWSPCTRTCGGGQRARVRQCVGGSSCEGDSQEIQECSMKPCMGEWGPWGEWGACSTTCEGGVSTRTRSCLNSDGSKATQSQCIGPSNEQTACNVNISCSELDCSTDSVACSGSINTQCICLLLILLLLNWLCTQR